MKNKILLLIAVATLGLTTPTMAQVPSYVPTNGLVGYWPFNGNANDESGNGNNGTVISASLSQDRFNNPNSCFSVDGINCPSAKGVSLPVNLSNALEYTINMWYFTNDSLKTYQTIFNSNPHQFVGVGYNYNGWGNITSGGIGNGTWLNAGAQSTIQWNTYNLLSWHSITLTKEITQFKFYEDGSLKFIYPITPAFNSGLINDIIVGAISGNGSVACYETFKGKLDDVGIWNRVLNQQEIADLYNGCQLSVSTQPANQTININNTAQFVVGSSDTNATYQWQTDLGVGFQNVSNAGQYSGAKNDTLTVANVAMNNNNQQFRCIINSGSCVDTSNVAVLTINNNVGIHEMGQHNLFSVFPNPAHNIINVKADHKLIGSVFTIYDNTGKAVQSGKINAANTSIELSNLSSGIYMFSVGENIKQTFKIIKE
jgi:hypothetical protein